MLADLAVAFVCSVFVVVVVFVVAVLAVAVVGLFVFVAFVFGVSFVLVVVLAVVVVVVSGLVLTGVCGFDHVWVFVRGCGAFVDVVFGWGGFVGCGSVFVVGDFCWFDFAGGVGGFIGVASGCMGEVGGVGVSGVDSFGGVFVFGVDGNVVVVSAVEFGWAVAFGWVVEGVGGVAVGFGVFDGVAGGEGGGDVSVLSCCIPGSRAGDGGVAFGAGFFAGVVAVVGFDGCADSNAFVVTGEVDGGGSLFFGFFWAVDVVAGVVGGFVVGFDEFGVFFGDRGGGDVGFGVGVCCSGGLTGYIPPVRRV